MTSAELVVFLELAVRGYTIRRIRELMAGKGYDLVHVPDAALINLMRGSEVTRSKKELDEDTRAQFGLANKLERVRRLCEAAEAIEKYADESSRWSAEYRRYLNQIQSELEPLEIEIQAGDSWAALLEKLGGLASVEEGNAETEGDDS